MLTIKNVLNKSLSGKKVCVRGWVRTRRDSKAGISFIQCYDGSTVSPVQIIVESSLNNYQDEILKITSGCCIKVIGILQNSPGDKQEKEILAKSVDVIGWVSDPVSYPIQAKKHTMEFLREVSHLRPRTNSIMNMSKIRNSVSQFIHKYLSDQGFIWIHTPIITTNDCEGAGELFKISSKNSSSENDFFGKETFLTVSGQLNAEAYCLAMSKVYTFGPTFRAENSNTSRHLAEFWMIEPEVAFANLDDIAMIAQKMLQGICKNVLENNQEELEFFNKFIDKNCIDRINKIISSDFPKITYTQAIDLLHKSKKKFNFPVKWGLDLQSEHERYLCEIEFKSPVIVTNYPKDIKSFYMRVNDDNKTVAAMDILVPGVGEIIGGSQREERLDILQNRIQECNIDASGLDWYIDLRKFGSAPHSGFGLGLERLISYITGLNNIRDVIPFPRTTGNARY